MATDLDRTASTPASKYDTFVAAQLARAEGRIRLLDLTASLLGFAALSLAYVVGMILCDSKLLLSPNTRQLALYGFLAGGAVYLFFAVVRPLRLRVNPYYAARQVEQQLPQAKNSIVNWVDLHRQQLPPAIRGALGQRAAKDLSRVDLDHAFSGRRAAWMGGLAGLFALAFIVSFFLLGPSPFLSLLKRTFNPFGVVGVSTRTQLTILKPEGGNAAVTVGRGINFVVEVNGKAPDPKAPNAVKLLYRYEESEPWLARLLIQEPSREWTTSLSAIEVRNGFWYKITGGDAATEEYRVSVRAAPAITDFLATYHFRPYVARADEVRRERELKELHGTEVLLRVRTNRTLRDGRLNFEGKNGAKIVQGEVDAADAHTLLVHFVLEEDGKYRLYFNSTENEAYSDPIAYPVTVIPDQPPVVELTKPGENIRLPADALLHLEGKASDDIGVKGLTLRMLVVRGDKLRGQPYRGDDALRLADGGYPLEVEYKDFIELSRVQREDGRAAALRAGMELEYWLEASDACDYPQANKVAESEHYRVLLTEPEKNEPKRQQEKKQADKDKKQHEQKQDQKLQQENQQRQQQRQEQEAENRARSASEGSKGGAGEQSRKKEGEQGNNGESKDNNGRQGEAKDGAGQQNNAEQKSELSKEDQKIEDQIKKALERKEESEDAKGEGKPGKGNQGEAKGAQQNKPDSGEAANEKSESGSKGGGQQDGKEASEGKDKGQPQAGGDPSQGHGKGDNQAAPMPGNKSEPKSGAARNENGSGKAGEDKRKNKPDAARQPGEGKPSRDPQAGKDAGQGKPQPMGQGQDSASGDGKAAAGKGRQAEREAAGEAKDNGGTPRRGEAKDQGGRKNDGKAEAKQGAPSAKAEKSAAGDAKPSPGQGESDARPKGESKPDAAAQARQATAKDIQDLARALESKNAHEREQAKRQLERIKKQAADAAAREKAGKALEKMGEPDGPADGGSPKPGKDSSGASGSERKDGDGSKGRGSSGSEEGDKGTRSDQKDGQGGKKGQGSSDNGASRGSQDPQGGSQTGGGERRSGNDDTSGSGEASPPSGKPAKPRDHRAAQMQLEDFAKKVNKDILKDAGVSEEAWKKYLEAKRKQLTPRQQPRPEAPSDPRQAVTLPSMRGRTIQPPDSGQGDIHGPDRGQPPPGYRDPFREFTRQMSKKN